MTYLPTWAPNLHPLFVHFPIVLLLLAPAVEFCHLLVRNQKWLGKMANLLYLLAAVAAVVTFFTGRFAADTLEIPSTAYTAISAHADAALYVLLLALLNGSYRGYLLLFAPGEAYPRIWRILPGLVTVVLLVITADRGARLVFQHGLGVTVGVEETNGHEQEHAEAAHSHTVPVGTHAHDEGSHAQDQSEASMKKFDWSATRDGAPGLLADFQWPLKPAREVSLRQEPLDSGSAVAFDLNGEAVAILFPAQFSNVEISATLNVDEFAGRVRLIHHYEDAGTYDFLEMNAEELLLGRIHEGDLRYQSGEQHHAQGYHTLKAVGAGGHFRGYVDGKLLAHGHGAELPDGQIGLVLQGEGTVWLTSLSGSALQ